MDNRMIIGISGKIGSGHSTAANIVRKILNKEHFGIEEQRGKYKDDISELNNKNSNTYKRWKVRRFSDKLKRITQIICNISDKEDIYSSAGKSKKIEGWKKTIGEMQLSIGVAIRNINKDAWVLALLGEYKEDKNWIIPDLRYPNEAQAILDKGGYLIRIEEGHKKEVKDKQHISETSLDNWDAKKWHDIIHNNGNVEDLENNLRETLVDLKLIKQLEDVRN